MTSYRLYTSEKINLKLTLFSGQIFSFKKTGENTFTGVFKNKIITFYQKNEEVFYDYEHEIQKELEIFFTLDIKYIPLLNFYKSICKEYNFEYSGLRLLRVDLLECIFSFICSTNNTVKRITKMVNYLFSKGEFLGEKNGEKFFKFPKLNLLIDSEDLKNKKFGYRSEYISETAKSLLNFSEDVLRGKCLNENFLVSLKGIGNKVSDCIKLMGLNKLDTVPIDTHVFKSIKILFKVNDKLSKKNYFFYQGLFRYKFGKYCGIAQLYIFKEVMDKSNKKIFE
ncbi:8-oxoguanine DNA glycosylase [Tubulinosema ratisbonensis]|uniref:DNA-(apurinic or apyrimidinic site) lyase n=1 Tax=Tubulinosema ratisbonensis TaxID=291195 RepID=A0A437AKQ2_9MICR|nr:8-oxoguanine DNA glycosylase [Tubulinosema ratisbonensis]